MKKVLYIIVAIIVILVIAYLLFVNFYPSFGGDVSKERQKEYETSAQFAQGKFNNEKNVPKDLSFKEMLKLGYLFFTTKVENGRPNKDLAVQKLDSAQVANYAQETRLIWYGHSAFLLQIEGKNILLDPMFTEVAAPHKLLGDSRFNKELPLAIEKTPKIDAIVISHDHYDHLDYESIKQLKSKTEHYFVPLGVGVHLEAWGISKENITELDWWEEAKYKDLKFICAPSQHFSGRKLGNNQCTLWSSWIVQSENENIYFSGDGGYAPHFKTIGEKYGPFDLALLECGQYNQMWADVHMMPEQTAQAGVDVKAKKIMPIHWGGFKLAMHSWTDPVVRVSAEAKKLNIPIITPQIGEAIILTDTAKTYKQWWKEYEN